MTLKTSKNLTVVGVLTIIGALVAAAIAVFDGNDATQPGWEMTFTAVMAGIGMIMGKGAASTGGTVDGDGKPVL